MILATAGKKERLSRLFVYYQARKIRDRIGHNGAELRDALDSMSLYGVATDRTWPFHFNRTNTEPNATAFADAAQYKVGSYNWAGKDLFKDYLHNETPIILGLYTGRMFWKLKGPISNQVYKSINTTDNRKHKGHAVTVIGYDDELLGGSWIVGNSLGLTWGDRGIGVLPYECYQDVGESYVITEFAGVTPGKNISVI
jgi:C1A family cysteine protease